MLIIGVSGLILSAEERRFLQHPAVVGVILFARNFSSKQQLAELCDEIRQCAVQPQLICVDQEGGRVQRFREGFAKLPCLEHIGALAKQGKSAVLALAEQHAYLMASEIIASGLDLSFAPVADLGRGNLAIGNRAFSSEPALVAEFVQAYVRGMQQAGMAATLKHFPGHGSVLADTHFDDAVDNRSFEEIADCDLLPFRAGIQAGADAVMMALVSYPKVHSELAGCSDYWIKQVLKSQLGFSGMVFSDDIGMAAAENTGGVAQRISLHLNAGCDVVLACAPAIVADALASMPVQSYAISRLDGMRAKQSHTWDIMASDRRYQSALESISKLEQI